MAKDASLRNRKGVDTTSTEPPQEEDKVKTMKRAPKKRLPSVAYLLKHGNPETAHLPKTTMEIVGYPVILALIFAISLLIFHHAPHDMSTHMGFKLPERRQGQGPPVPLHRKSTIMQEPPVKPEETGP